ncbi:MAG TPA: type 1 glutamine amidotransferase domain-containing protein [Chloroflexota bacterium]|nr:type 1 glutamine amidotransferase domain-containing protein [Chloroflexota bacterium]
MELSGTRIAILAEDVYEDLELLYPLYRMREAGAEVTVVGPEAKSYTSKHGIPVTAEKASADTGAHDFDAVIIPGGFAPDRMRRDPNLVRLVRDACDAGKPVAAICHAGWVLAEADVCRGRTLTSVGAIKTDLKNAGATWVDREVVRDGNLITSRTPADLPAFCRAIIEALAEKSGVSGSAVAAAVP